MFWSKTLGKINMRKIVFLTLCSLFATSAQAGGFASSSGMSASAAGVANAVVAGADDVSAATYNPAGLAWQDGVQVMAGVNLQYRNSSVRIPAGVASNLGGASNLSHLYAAWIPRESNLGVSLAFNRPFEADNNWTGAFAGTGSSVLRMDRLSLDGIYRLNSNMAFAVGGDWYLASATMTQPGQRFSGTGRTSFGGHASMKWKPAPMWSLGATARIGSNIKIDSGTQNLSIKLPDEFVFGAAYDAADAVRLELDANWSRWSKLKDLNVVNGATVVQANALDLKDTLSLMFGVTWFWRENSQFRFGYAYEQGANSSTGFHPVVADQTGHKIALGAGGDVFGFHGDLAYHYTFYPKKSASGTYAGTYRDRRHGLAFSVSKAF